MIMLVTSGNKVLIYECGTFSKLEADGKLVMEYCKAPTSLSSEVCAQKHLFYENVGNAL